jgi:uncharacterized protein
MSIAKKRKKLCELLREAGPSLVAYSGGVDSTLLAVAAFEELGAENFLAVIGDSPSLPRNSLSSAVDFLKLRGMPYRVIPTSEMSDPKYLQNNFDRCYHCKKDLFDHLARIGREVGFDTILYGFNTDDIADYRPGNTAAAEFGVKSPLSEAGLTKSEIRALSNELGIPNWNRPAQPCLSSRLLYGTPVTPANLELVEKIEAFLRGQGLSDCRARYDGTSLRVEVPKAELELIALAPWRDELVALAIELGACFVSLDLEGLVSGKNNRLIEIADKVDNG